jgi:nucleotide-binding universal stress UspA family protein
MDGKATDVASVAASPDPSPAGTAVPAWVGPRSVVADRHPAEALVSLSADAELLVVGSRGHGGFGELLLGSVSHAVVLHAVCPVVVVPSQRDERRTGQPRQ